MTIRAKFNTTCPRCKGLILAGELITKDEQTGKWTHADNARSQTGCLQSATGDWAEAEFDFQSRKADELIARLRAEQNKI